jgi:hypothetical protein
MKKIINDFPNELATKEFIRSEINELRFGLKQNTLLLKVLLGIAI